MIFLALTIGSLLAFAGIFMLRNQKFEEGTAASEENSTNAGFVLGGVLVLCIVMCIYVGFENGFAFFVDTMFTDVLRSSSGKFALSLFWAVMIPSRILVGLFAQHAKKILVTAIIAIPTITILISLMSNGNAVMALCVPLGFACGAIYPSVLTTLLQYSGNRKATATAMITTATGIGGVVFTALTGIMAGNMGLRAAMVFLSAFFIIPLIFVLILFKAPLKRNN